MRLGLGTAQFGMDYGLTNRTGKIRSIEASRILEAARELGFHVIDTAPQYADSECILGRYLKPSDFFQVITKTRSFPHDPMSQAEIDLLISQDLEESLERLGTKCVYALLIHHAKDLLGCNGPFLFKAMQRLQAAGKVLKIGISVYSEREIREIVTRFQVDLIQLPLNVLDQRLIKTGCLKWLREHGIEIHSRSAFLQGLLLADIDELDSYFDPLKPVLQVYNRTLLNLGLSRLEGALQFVKLQREIDCLIVGVCSEGQLRQVFEAFNRKVEVPFSYQSFSSDQPEIVNPALWPQERRGLL